jgi:hypothetical protein
LPEIPHNCGGDAPDPATVSPAHADLGAALAAALVDCHDIAMLP